MQIHWKKIIIGTLDVILAIYLVMAVTAWNTPDKTNRICTKVDINISDSNNSGFLSAEEIKKILVKKELYPLNKQLKFIEPRKIEEALKVGPFVNTAECYVTENGHVNITISQRMPIIRIKSENGDDYYLDDNGGILPNSKYTSDLIIASGNISQWFARYGIAPLAKTISQSNFWLNQIEQINVREDRGIEIVPRVGEHIAFLGFLPTKKGKSANEKSVSEFAKKKLTRLEKFYRYGLAHAGWNKYSYINVEFDNQIICKRRTETETQQEVNTVKTEKKEETVKKEKPEETNEATE
ncbi:UNVERIFIED_CONTAM: cell division protein FtsQ [Prevotella sp. 15_C9]